MFLNNFDNEEEEDEEKDEILRLIQKKKMKKKAVKINNKVKKINKIIPFKNNDKSFHERWKKGDNWLNFPHPTKVLFFSCPNAGKTTTILNCILQQDPPFKKIYVLHPDEQSEEYNILGTDNFIFLNKVPDSINFSDRNEKSLLIIDDIDFTNLNKKDKAILDRISGYVSTHRNLSVYVTSQNFTSIFPSFRRNVDVFFIWNHIDKDSLNRIGKKCGFKNNKLLDLLDKHCKERFDNLCIDGTPNSPAKLRLNAYTKIEEE